MSDPGSEAEEKGTAKSMADTIAANVRRQNLWVVIEKELGIDTPLYLKHLLNCFGFDSAAALKNITSDLFPEMEKFAQTDMLELLGDDHYIKSDFFGIYSSKPQQFRILPGHRLCLLEIKQYITEKGLKHFATAEQDINEKSTNIKAKKGTLQAGSAKKLRLQSQVELEERSQDLLSEEDGLYKLIKNWFIKQPNGNDIFRDYLENPKNRYLAVSVKEDDNNDITYSAKISCCLCQTKITAHKAEYGKSEPRKTRWVCQNFIKHVKEKHLNSNSVNSSKENLSPCKGPETNQVDTKSGQTEKNSTTVLTNVIANTAVLASNLKRVQPLITDIFDKGTNYNDNRDANASLANSFSDKGQAKLPRIIDNVVLKTATRTRRGIKAEKRPRENESDEDTEVNPRVNPTEQSKNKIKINEELGESQPRNNVGVLCFEQNLSTPSTSNAKNSENLCSKNLRSENKIQRDRRTRRDKRYRQRVRSITTERTIPHYFATLNEMELLLKYNAELEDCVKNLLAESAPKKLTTPFSKNIEIPEVNENNKSNLFVQKLMNISQKQSQTESRGNRYDCTVKKFASYIFMIGGRLAYETLCANLPLPSPSSVSRYLSENGPVIIEGQLRLQELKDYLNKAELPLVIWLSEDATRITGTVQYDQKTNQLIGLVLPIDKNGMPQCKSFLATSPKVMEETMQNISTASLVYTIMAQPLQKNSASFCLCIFGTDNKFTAEHVINRFQFIYEQCQQFGIKVLGFSSDGDPRLLKAMKIESQIGISNTDLSDDREDWTWFNSKFCTEYLVCQDTIHIGTKLRNRLIKNSIVLPMGDTVVTVSHLKLLIKSISKDKHQVTPSDLDPKDKMNFPSVQKIYQEKVRILLNDTVPGSEGTCQYLKILHHTIVSYIDPDLDPLERIFMIWYSVFCLRMWRAWILADDSYTLGKNFITANCYACIEINAHALIDVIIRLRDSDQPELFLPTLYSSQPCESFFRLVRSMSSTYSTIVNCSMLDIIHRLKRIQVQNEIIIEESENIVFPRFRERKCAINGNTYALPSNQEIQKTVEDAKCKAIEDLGNLGIFSNDTSCSIPISAKFIPEDTDDESDDEEISVETEVTNEETVYSEELEQDMLTLQSVTGTLELKDYSARTVKLNERSPFAVVRDSSQAEYIVRKSSICWLLNKNKHRLSSDRLQRVREIELPKSSMKEAATLSSTVEENMEISVGEWVLFRVDTETKPDYRVGLILGFVYLTRKTDQQREYSRLSADVDNESIGVLCTWYRILSADLRPIPVKSHNYECISGYTRTLPTPQIVDKRIYYSESVLKLIHEIIPTSPEDKVVCIGDFVLIEFLAKRTKKYYIGVVRSIQSSNEFGEQDYEVKFMRQMTGSSNSKFVFPDVDDTSHVTENQIKLILNEPKIDRRHHHIFSEPDLFKYTVI